MGPRGNFSFPQWGPLRCDRQRGLDDDLRSRGCRHRAHILAPRGRLLRPFELGTIERRRHGPRFRRPTILPNGDVFQIGKAGVGYILSGTDLGGIGGQLYNASVCSGAYGGTARVGQSIIVPCTNGLTDVLVGGSAFSVAWQTSEFDSGSPIVTGDVVWAVDISDADLLGFNLSSGHQVFSFPLGSADHFITPAAAPGSLFVAGGSQLYAFELA